VKKRKTSVTIDVLWAEFQTQASWT